MIFAARYSSEAVDMLLDRGANPHVVDMVRRYQAWCLVVHAEALGTMWAHTLAFAVESRQHQRTPLCHAIEGCQIDAVGSLMRAGVDYRKPLYSVRGP